MRHVTSSRRGVTRSDAVAGVAVLVLFAGFVSTALTSNQEKGNIRKATNNLKQVGLAIHNHNDTMNYLPFNGGHTDPDKLKTVNFGWHSPNVRDSGTWATMILPFMEQDPFYRNVVLTGEAVDKVPTFLTDAENNAIWHITFKNYMCPERSRVGFKTSVENDSMPGQATDYAINVFLNSPPTTYTTKKAANGVELNAFATNGGMACAPNSKMTIQGIQDGSNNTVLAGQKAMSKTLMESKDANHGDEGIFSPGHYTAKGKESKVASTGTARGHRVDPNSKATDDQKTMSKDGGVPWMHKDSDLAGKTVPDFASDWGSPFTGGVLFLWGDGTVRTVGYKANGKVNFARMLYPSDGCVVTFDD